MTKLTVETKRDQPQKRAAVKTQGSAFFLSAEEVNAIVQAVNQNDDALRALPKTIAKTRTTALEKATREIHVTYSGNPTGDLSALQTQVKTNIIAAINSLKNALDDPKTVIEDTLPYAIDKTYSIDKIRELLARAVGEVKDGAPRTLDTLRKLAEALEGHKQLLEHLSAVQERSLLMNRPQKFTQEEREQGQDNLEVMSRKQIKDHIKTAIQAPEIDYLKTYIRSKTTQ